MTTLDVDRGLPRQSTAEKAEQALAGEPGAEDLRADGIRFGPGATGTIGYLAKMFPRISESFILNEVLALRRHGLDVRVYSILPPTRDSRMHDEALSLLDEVYIIPELHWRNIGS